MVEDKEVTDYRLIYANQGGVLEIKQGHGNLKPGEKGQHVGQATWFRVNSGEWMRSKVWPIYKARLLAEQVCTCAEFIEKARED